MSTTQALEGPKMSYLKSVSALWNCLQLLHSVGFSVFYTQNEQKIVLKALLNDPILYRHCLPGVTHCILSSTESVSDVLRGVLLSFEGGRNNHFNTYFNYLRDTIDADQEVVSRDSNFQIDLTSSLRSSMFSLSKELLVVAVAHVNDLSDGRKDCQNEYSYAPIDNFISLLVDCVSLDVNRLLKKGVELCEADLETSFVGSILATLCSSLASSESTKCIAIFYKYVMRLLELYGEVMVAPDLEQKKYCPNLMLQTWLGKRFRWLLLFVASAIRCLLKPPEALSAPTLSVRGLYACCLHFLSPTELEASCLQAQSSIYDDSDMRAWLGLHNTFEGNGLNLAAAVVTDFPESILITTL